MLEYQTTEHDKALLKISSQAAQSVGMDGTPNSSALRSAQAVEDYATHRTIAAVLIGLKKRGINIDEKTVLGAFVDGKQEVPDLGFESPLLKGKQYKV